MGAKCIIEMDGPTTIIKNPSVEGPAGIKTFSFDYSYWSYDQSNKKNWADQLRVFNDLGVSILNNAFQGYNCSIFAYGLKPFPVPPFTLLSSYLNINRSNWFGKVALNYRIW